MEAFALLLGALVLGALMMPTVILFVTFDPWSFVGVRPQNVPRGVWLRAALLVAVEIGVVLVGVAWLMRIELLLFAVVTLVAVAATWSIRWLVRRTIWEPWRRGARGHRVTALLLSIVGPAGLVLVLAAAEARFDAMISASTAVGAVAMFVASYPTALLMLHWLSGEYDPPASKPYRRRG